MAEDKKESDGVSKLEIGHPAYGWFSISISDKALKKAVDLFRDVFNIEGRKIKNLAKAESEAKITRVRGERALEAEERLSYRLRKAEERRQHNLECIVRDKMPHFLPADDRIDSQPVDPDWGVHFINQCQDVSDDDMQKLWAKILAGEIASPGSFSRRTLNRVGELSKGEANLFEHFASFIWHLRETMCFFRVYRNTIEADFFTKMTGIPFEGFVQLSDAGLIEMESNTHYTHRGSNPPDRISYQGSVYEVKSSPNIEVNVPCMVLTPTGRELYRLAKVEQVEWYVEATTRLFTQCGGELVRLPNQLDQK